MALVLLSINVAALFLTAKPVIAPTCGDGLHEGASYTLRLEHGKPVTLNYEVGQTVILAGSPTSETDLEGTSVVGIYLSPSGAGIGYSNGEESLPAQSIHNLLVPGANEVKLVAVDKDDVAFLIVRLPCDSVKAQVQGAITPSPEPMPTITASAIIASTATVGHTPEHGALMSSIEASPSEDSDISLSEQMFSRRIGRILIALVLLGLLIFSTMGGFAALRRRIGWD
jgi:hypothetical protein